MQTYADAIRIKVRKMSLDFLISRREEGWKYTAERLYIYYQFRCNTYRTMLPSVPCFCGIINIIIRQEQSKFFLKYQI